MNNATITMKPSKIKPGQEIRINGRIGFYVRRYPTQSGRPAINIIRVPDYAGLNGPDDDGSCQISDYDFSHKVTRI